MKCMLIVADVKVGMTFATSLLYKHRIRKIEGNDSTPLKVRSICNSIIHNLLESLTYLSNLSSFEFIKILEFI
jgi:hypothetical protein